MFQSQAPLLMLRDAGVSIKTVSRVINGELHVTLNTREKVLNAVQKLHFKVNAAARSLRSKTAKRLVLALDNPSQSYTEAVQINAVLACQPLTAIATSLACCSKYGVLICYGIM